MMISYRTERAYGSHIRDIKLVLQHEIFVLGNSDILCYIRDNYKDAFDDAALYTIDEMIGVSAAQKDIDMLDEEIFISDLVAAISECLGYPLHYALWLADRAVVEYFYDAKKEDIDAYEISPCILCDLGPQGTLYGYTEMPEPLDIKWYQPSTDYFKDDLED